MVFVVVDGGGDVEDVVGVVHVLVGRDLQGDFGVVEELGDALDGAGDEGQDLVA